MALLGAGIDHLLGIADFKCALADGLGCALIAAGFLLRTWAAFHFYMRDMDVIVLHAQKHLITTGPYRFSRNPLYLGGNVFIFCGASLILGTSGGLALIILHLPLVDFMIRRGAPTPGDLWRRMAGVRAANPQVDVMLFDCRCLVGVTA